MEWATGRGSGRRRHVPAQDRFRPCDCSRFMAGMLSSSAWLYGCLGPRKNSSASASSTMRPRYMTTTRVHRYRMTGSECEIMIRVRPKTPPEIRKQVQDLSLHGGVQGRDRFVGDQQARLQRQRPCDGDTLLLPAAQLRRDAAGHGVVEPHLPEQLRHPRRTPCARSPDHGFRKVPPGFPQPSCADPERRRDPGRRSGIRAAGCAVRPAPGSAGPDRRSEWTRRWVPDRRRAQRASVVLPHPDSPTIPSVSPGATTRSMPASACIFRPPWNKPVPKLLRRPRISRRGAIRNPRHRATETA